MARNARCRSTSATQHGRRRVVARPGRGTVEVGLGEGDVAGRGLEPAGEQQRGRPSSRRGPGAGSASRTRAAPAVPSPRTTQVQPNPFAIRSAEPRVVGGAPGQRDVDVRPLRSGDRQALGLPRAADVRVAPRGRSGVPRGVRRGRGVGAGRTRAAGRRRTPGCCRAVGSAPPRPSAPRRSPGIGRPAGRSCRAPRRAGRRARRARARSRPGTRRRRSTTAPTARAGRRGTAGRSSRRSPRPARGGAQAAGWSDRGAARTGRPAAGRCRATESDLHPRGRELDRQRQAVEGRGRPARRRGRRRRRATSRRAPLRGHAGEQLDRRRLASAARARARYSLVEPERHLAGRQHREPRRRGRAARATSSATAATTCSQLSSSRTVSAPDSRSGSALATRAACSVSATTWARSSAMASTASSRTSQTPPGGRSRAADLHGEPGLADPGRPDHGHQPVPASAAVTARPGLVAADQRRRRRRQVARGRRRRGRPAASRSRALPQHPPLEAPQRRPRLDPELVDAAPAAPAVRRQRVGLPARAVQRGDQRRPEALAQRVRSTSASARRPPRRRRRGRPGRRARSRPAPAAPPPAGPGAAAPSHRRRRSTSPAEQRQPLGGRPATPPGRRPPRRRRARRGPRPGGVDAAGVDVQGVAVAARRRPAPGPERPAQLGDLRLQRVAGGRRRPTGPRSARRRGRSCPASSASRASSSVVLPAGSSSRTPSRRTSTGPRTATVSTLRP